MSTELSELEIVQQQVARILLNDSAWFTPTASLVKALGLPEDTVVEEAGKVAVVIEQPGDIDFEIDRALASLGIVATVGVPSLDDANPSSLGFLAKISLSVIVEQAMSGSSRTISAAAIRVARKIRRGWNGIGIQRGPMNMMRLSQPGIEKTVVTSPDGKPASSDARVINVTTEVNIE